jgi:SAM-dependent methyltransferase
MTRPDAVSSVQAFYDLHPYPPPVEALEGYRKQWLDEGRRRADFHLHWPWRPYQENLGILVAGCGTSQAARHALRQPASQVVGIDFSPVSVRHTEALRRRHQIANLQVRQLGIEQAAELGMEFDKIVCTGVLHHLPDPDRGLRALYQVLRPDGVMHLMVYAPYGRAGIYLVQEYCRRLGLGNSAPEVTELARTLEALPSDHPLARLLGSTPDFQRADGLADALLNPLDRAFSVPQLLAWLERCGLRLLRWVRQAPYLPHCGAIGDTPHAARLEALPPSEQYAALELFRGNMLRHTLIACRADASSSARMPDFDSEAWIEYRPIRLPESRITTDPLRPGAAAGLRNRGHLDADLVLWVDELELRLVRSVDGQHTVGELIQAEVSSARSDRRAWEWARGLFGKLWRYDQIVFDGSRSAG